jgi:excisionase family DNA binding protein
MEGLVMGEAMRNVGMPGGFATTQEVAEYLKCHPETVRVMCRKKQLRAVRVGSDWRIPIEAVQEYLGAQLSA